MEDAVKVDDTDLVTLRKMCELRGIAWHPRHKPESLQKLIDEYEQNNAPPGDTVELPEVEVGEAFACSTPQAPDWANEEKAESPECYEPPPRRELPENVQDALKYLSAYSVGRVKLVKRYIDSLR